MNLLELKEIYKVYGEGIIALKNINLSIEKGDFLTIMGPSGSGKSTLLKIASTVLEPSAGKVKINGSDIKFKKDEELILNRRRNLGFVFQDFKLLEELNVEDNIILPLVLERKKRKFIKEKLLRYSELLGIEKILKKNIINLSGGEKQQVAIARALINDPMMIFVDEGTGKLDFNTSQNIMKLFQKINKELKTTIFMVTHDPYVASFSERVVFLRDGEIYNEIYSGDSKKDFYKSILDVVSFLGGKTYEI